jgi:hypothetical protein
MIYPSNKRLGNRVVWVYINEENPDTSWFFVPLEITNIPTVRKVRSSSRKEKILRVLGGSEKDNARLRRILNKRGFLVD